MTVLQILLLLMPSSLALLTIVLRMQSPVSVGQLQRHMQDQDKAEHEYNLEESDGAECLDVDEEGSSDELRELDEVMIERIASGDFIGTLPSYASWSIRRPHSHVSLVTTTSAELKELLPWILYHRVLGVDMMYVFLEGNAITTKTRITLERIEGVKVIPPAQSLREKQFRSRIWQEDNVLLDSKYGPCLSQLYMRQTLNLEAASSMAKRGGMKWIMHLAVDEMLYPGGAMHARPLATLFNRLDRKIDVVVFPHYEGVVELENIVEPFTEVTLFKRSPAHVSRQDMIDGSKSVRFETGRSPYFLGYPFGRAAARLQRGLRSDGPHRWTHRDKTLRGLTMEEAVVLHYPYARFADLKAFKDVCTCQLKRSDLARCFTNEFDRSAFTAAKTLSDSLLFEWFRDHIVWSNRTVLNGLIKRSIFVRIQILQVIIDGLRNAGRFDEVIEAGEKRMDEDEHLGILWHGENRRARSMLQYQGMRATSAEGQTANTWARPGVTSTRLVEAYG